MHIRKYNIRLKGQGKTLSRLKNYENAFLFCFLVWEKKFQLKNNNLTEQHKIPSSNLLVINEIKNSILNLLLQHML